MQNVLALLVKNDEPYNNILEKTFILHDLSIYPPSLYVTQSDYPVLFSILKKIYPSINTTSVEALERMLQSPPRFDLLMGLLQKTSDKATTVWSQHRKRDCFAIVVAALIHASSAWDEASRKELDNVISAYRHLLKIAKPIRVRNYVHKRKLKNKNSMEQQTACQPIAKVSSSSISSPEGLSRPAVLSLSLNSNHATLFNQMHSNKQPVQLSYKNTQLVSEESNMNISPGL